MNFSMYEKNMKKLKIALHIVYMGAIISMKVEFAPHLALDFKGFFFSPVSDFGNSMVNFSNVAYNRDNIFFLLLSRRREIKWVF